MKLYQSLILATGLLTMPLANAAVTTLNLPADSWDVTTGVFVGIDPAASSVWTYDTDPAMGIPLPNVALPGGGSGSGVQFFGGAYGAVTTPASPVNATQLVRIALLDNAVASADATSDFLGVYSAAGHDPGAAGDVMIFESDFNNFNLTVVMAFQPTFLDSYLTDMMLPAGDNLLSHSHFIYATLEQFDGDSNVIGFARMSENLNPVPLPPAVWLLGSALGGLLLRQRRQGQA